MEHEERRLTRYVPLNTGQTSAPSGYRTSGLKYVQALLKNLWRPAPTMPGPLLTFEGIGDLCGCQPSDSEGDVGPNHYVEAINESFKIFDKNGNTLAGPIGYDTFFAPLTGTPCGSNQNDGDPFVLYDPVNDRFRAAHSGNALLCRRAPTQWRALGPSTPYRWTPRTRHSWVIIRSSRSGTMAGRKTPIS